MLPTQGCAQCELWTRRAAPRAEIATSLARFLETTDFGTLPARLQQEIAISRLQQAAASTD